MESTSSEDQSETRALPLQAILPPQLQTIAIPMPQINHKSQSRAEFAYGGCSAAVPPVTSGCEVVLVSRLGYPESKAEELQRCTGTTKYLDGLENELERLLDVHVHGLCSPQLLKRFPAHKTYQSSKLARFIVRCSSTTPSHSSFFLSPSQPQPTTQK